MPPRPRVAEGLLLSPAGSSNHSLDVVKSTPDVPVQKKGAADVVPRVIWTLIMAYSFLALVASGMEFVIPVVVLIKILMFWEIVRISQKERKERQLPLVRFLQSYFLAVTIIGGLATALQDPLVAAWPALKKYYDSIFVVVFGCLITGFVFFVMSLRRGHYRYQMTQFSWLAMTLVFITAQGSLQYVNMLRGMFWFLLPVSCVVHNDIWAYACGKMFGRTPLLRLSPKKTLEGFVGAWIMTTIWAFWFAGFMTRFPSLICPKLTLFVNEECTVGPIFQPAPLLTPPFFAELTGITAVNVAPVQLHAFVFAAFASLLAPFGGFFASGLKRAFKLKDFGDLIPGHGGMTDRMDCQIIMGAFTFVYVSYVVYGHAGSECPTPATLIECLRNLPPEALSAVLREVQV